MKAAATLLVLGFTLGVSAKADSPWTDAFPEESFAENETSLLSQGGLGLAESLVGSVYLAKGKTAAELAAREIYDLNEISYKLGAAEFLKKRPDLAVEIRVVMGNAEPLAEGEALRQFSSTSERRYFQRELRKKIKAEADLILGRFYAGQVPAEMAANGAIMSKVKFFRTLRLAGAGSLALEGAARLGAALMQRDPGYSPLMNAGRATAKQFLPTSN